MNHIGRPSLLLSRRFFVLGLGNALEWYDWHIWAIFAADFSLVFFNSSMKASHGHYVSSHMEQMALTAAMLTFFIGFLARPIGAIVLGYIGDKKGRRISVIASIVLSTIALFVIAFVPPRHSIGIAAVVIVIMARVLQGFAHGAELPSVQAYVAEVAPMGKRNIYASTIYITGTLGSLVALALGLVLHRFLTHEQMIGWGWRIPFVIGGLAGIVIALLRMNLTETHVWSEHQKIKIKQMKQSRSAASIINGRDVVNLRRVVAMMGTVCGGTFAYYVWVVAMPSLARVRFGYSAYQALSASFINLLLFLILLVFFGHLADKMGHRKLIAYSSLIAAISYFPLVWWIQSSRLFIALFIAIFIQQACQAAAASHGAMFAAELVPTHTRMRTMALTYAIPVALFGGSAGAVFSQINNLYVVGVYGGVLLLITTISTWALPETGGKNLHHDISHQR